ncbi:MAG TPA: glycosyltransferase family 4 protein [Phycisphaerales bacterium]|nr:glycosyltransferase family 4 protein [Phycisphaerales bacterium]
MRVAIVWHSISGYMAACWRALAAEMGDDLLVVTQRPDPKGTTPFDPGLVKGVNVELVEPARLEKRDGVVDVVAAHRPDVVVLNGWFVPAFAALASGARLASARKIMAIDRPRETWWKDHANRARHRALLRRCDMVFVTGERCFEFARFLGFEERRIRRGTYGVDVDAFGPIYERRAARPGGWPRSFVYMGRYDSEKGLDVLVEAYGEYRGGVADAWPLVCCGRGEHGGLLRGVAGVQDRGFVQPADQPALLEEQGVFVLASRFDPWPLVIVESCAAGLPVVCSNACGSAVELVRSYYSGLQAATGDAQMLARSLRWMHGHREELPEMGRRSRELARAYSAQMWATRWMAAFEELVREG